MIKLITISDIKKLIDIVGIQNFFLKLIPAIEKEYARWEDFKKSARHAIHTHDGVFELMPICDNEFYTFKYVNGHPGNPHQHKMTVVAMGALADIKTGYPLMISEMTLLTALRTAGTSALAAKYLARSDSKIAGIIGTGAQSEFQIMAQHALFNLKTVKYFDIDPNAMKKFSQHLCDQSFELIACNDPKSVVDGVDIITTATANKSREKILQNDFIHNGLHINGIGGDCPGKTELDIDILSRAKIVVEYLPQSKHEGEIQEMNCCVYAELWELACGKKPGRENKTEITLFDSVGFAIEDFAILKLIYSLSLKYNLGTSVDLIPELQNPKDLFELIV